MGWFKFHEDGRFDQYNRDQIQGLVWENDGSIGWPIQTEYLRATIEDNVVTAVSYTPPIDMYCFLTLAADTIVDGIPWVLANDTDAVTATVKLTAVDDINAPPLPVTKDWLISVFPGTKRDEWVNVLMSIVDGEGVGTFTTSNATDHTIYEDTFTLVMVEGYGTFKVRLRVLPDQSGKGVPADQGKIFAHK